MKSKASLWRTDAVRLSLILRKTKKKAHFNRDVFALCYNSVLLNCNVFWSSKIELDEVYVLNSSYSFAERF